MLTAYQGPRQTYARIAMNDDYDSAAEALADMTGRPKEVFEPDYDEYPIPDFDEQELVFPDDE